MPDGLVLPLAGSFQTTVLPMLLPQGQLPGWRAWRAMHARWLRFCTPYDPDSPDAARFRSLQLQPLLAASPWVMVANFVNVLVVCWLFRHSEWLVAVGLWGATTLAASLLGRRAWKVWREGQWPRYCSSHTLWRATRNAVIMAILWAVPMVVGYPLANEVGRVALLLIAVGMLCGGAFVLSPVPRAAANYVLLLTLAVLGGLTTAGLARHLEVMGLTLLYAVMVLAAALHLARQFGERMMAEADSTRQKQLVHRLLHDFEQHANDWLWELA